MAGANSLAGAPRSDWPDITAALGGRSRTAIEVFQPAELATFSNDLAEQARVDIVATERSLPTSRTQETRDLVIQSAVPFDSRSARSPRVWPMRSTIRSR